MTFGELVKLTGIDEPRISEYSTGKAKQIRTQNANILVTHLRRMGFETDDIWHFEEDEGPPEPVRKRKG